jgi:ABC-type enterochelin transport system substrate-binding protein
MIKGEIQNEEDSSMLFTMIIIASMLLASCAPKTTATEAAATEAAATEAAATEAPATTGCDWDEQTVHSLKARTLVAGHLLWAFGWRY